MNTIKIKVNGMVCNGCENRVCNTVKDIEGVIEVEASHENNLVQLKTNKEIDINEIYKKIETLGFEVIKED